MLAIAPSTGKRKSLRNIPRELRETELLNPGVQKLILEELQTAEAKCETLARFVERYLEADKRVAVLEEKLKTHAALEVFFALGISLGSLILGLLPTFWDGTVKGPAALVIGALFVTGSVVARVIRR